MRGVVSDIHELERYMLMLADAPGWPELIARLHDVAADLALFFVGAPDEGMRAALNKTRENLKRDLADTLGAEVAGQIAEAFAAAVAGRKAEIEARVTASSPFPQRDLL